MRIAFPGAKSAELARENANIRIIDVAIQDIRGAISVFSLPNHIGDETKGVDICGAIKARSFVLVDSFRRNDFLADRAQFLRYKPAPCEIFHKLNLTQDDSRI